jgi:hypothetical protein
VWVQIFGVTTSKTAQLESGTADDAGMPRDLVSICCGGLSGMGTRLVLANSQVVEHAAGAGERTLPTISGIAFWCQSGDRGISDVLSLITIMGIRQTHLTWLCVSFRIGFSQVDEADKVLGPDSTENDD